MRKKCRYLMLCTRCVSVITFIRYAQNRKIGKPGITFIRYAQNRKTGKPGITFIRYAQNRKTGKPGITFIRYAQNRKIGKPGITFIRYAQNRQIGKPNDLKVFGRNKTKGPKQYSHNQLRSPMTEEHLK
jgi:hypothetical protein